MQNAPEQWVRVIRSVVESMAYELVGVEYIKRGPSGGLLRIYIDQEAGVTLDDCASVSHQVSGVLDVENLIAGHYELEVSSPGLDRPLFCKDHFVQFTGRTAKVKLARPLAGRKRFQGVLAGVEGDRVVLELDGKQVQLPLDHIEMARLVPEF